MPTVYPLQKIILGVFTFFLFFIFLVGNAYAAGTTGQQLSITNYKAPQNTDYSIMNLEHGLVCESIGTSVFPNQTCIAYAPNGTLQAYAVIPNGGAIGGLNNAMVAMYNTPPATMNEYVADLGTNFGLIPKARAQVAGSGSGVIQPVYKIWQIVRDISYLGFILVFIIIGFMIMFRQKLNPQTVITVQSALPGLVIGLVLVTFSYFIAALLIDFSFIAVQIVGALFVNVGGNGLGNGQELTNISQHADIFYLFKLFTLNGNTFSTVASPIISAFNGPSASEGITIQGIAVDIFHLINPSSIAVEGAIGSGVSGLVYTILVIAVVIQMLRLVWAMLQAYISIFVNTILGPIFILYSTLPGRRGVLGFWWKNILGNALIFPAVFAAILFAGFMVGSIGSSPQIGASLPFLTFPQGILRGILAFGIILGTPAIPKMVKSAIGVKDLGDIATAAVAGATAGVSTFGTMGQAGFRSGSEYLGLPARKKALQDAAVAGSASSKAARLPDWVAKRFG